MPTIHDFIRPKEWVSDFVTDLGHAIREWDERSLLKTRGLALYVSNSVERACSRAMDFMGSYGHAREFDIEKHWRDQKVVGLWMGGKGLKTLENARYWYDLETL
jgi:alkylation response protein AidB-like acyl-CoA dehydrogenase